MKAEVKKTTEPETEFLDEALVLAREVLALEARIPIDEVRQAAPLAKELHHLFARQCHLRPTGFRFRVLL